MVYGMLDVIGNGSPRARIDTDLIPGVGSLSAFLGPDDTLDSMLMKALISFEEYKPLAMSHRPPYWRLFMFLRLKNLHRVYRTWRTQKRIPEIHRAFCEKHGRDPSKLKV